MSVAVHIKSCVTDRPQADAAISRKQTLRIDRHVFAVPSIEHNWVIRLAQQHVKSNPVIHGLFKALTCGQARSSHQFACLLRCFFPLARFGLATDHNCPVRTRPAAKAGSSSGSGYPRRIGRKSIVG